MYVHVYKYIDMPVAI